MMFILPILALFSASTWATDVRRWEAGTEVLDNDLRRIEKQAGWKSGAIQFNFSRSTANTVSISCEDDSFQLNIAADPQEKMSTLYHALFRMGFLFPHPRWQISPELSKARLTCGKTYEWRPSFKYRGFHLHTLHPNEWGKGFLEGQNEIAFDYIRWLARNRQNVLDVSILRPKWYQQMNSLREPMKLAKAFGISRGVSLGAALQQQNSWRLIPILQSMTGIGDEKQLRKNITLLNSQLDYDFMTMEIGTTEFTSTNYEKSLKWMNLAATLLASEGKKLFTKNHVSTNQVSPKWGNFNFLPRFANKDVGLMPHTVMFYGLYDESAPMYGNKNFAHMLKFIQEEKDNRAVWYYPETSYWVFMDQDAPLFLTDYLTTRSEDMKGLYAEGVEGHFNFTSGQEMGYWLFDWNVALNADLDLEFDPKIAMKLLGEDLDVWQSIIDYQTEFMKNKQLISIVSFSNLQDEISKHRIHKRNTLKEVANSSFIRESEIKILEEALSRVPDVSGVKNEELRLLLEVTELRMKHALAVRTSLRSYVKSDSRWNNLQSAAGYRSEAQTRIDLLIKKYNRYPGARVFDWRESVTSYNFGSLWTVATLFHWKREERMAIRNKYNPFFDNIVNPIDIIF